MNSEERTCQNCEASFKILPEDMGFYEKVRVPPPTWCSECRLVRRMMWGFDSRTLYQRTCDAPGHSEKIFSAYAPEVKNPVYDYEYWRSDAWDPRDYGRDYDFSRSFFEQWKELLDEVPLRNLELTNSVRCEYCKSVTDSKDCYFCTATFGSERCSYCHTAIMCKDSISIDLSLLNERTYDSFSLDKSFDTTHAVYSAELLNCNFMYDTKNCSDCLGCVGLRGKKYCILNKEYSKDEYKKERAKYDLGSYKVEQQVREKHNELIRSFPKKFMIGRNAPDSTGDNLINVKNCRYVFQAVDNVEDCTYAFVVGRGTKEAFDVSGAGLKSDTLYECVTVTGSQRVLFSTRIYNSHDVFYSRDCYDSAFLFGCVGLRSKKHCILNKEYSKEEYNKLVPKIIEHMRSMVYTSPRGQTYQFGEFFPLEHSLLFYNDSWASEHFPLSKAEAQKRNYQWHEEEKRSHAVTVSAENLPDHIRDVPDTITNEVIGCFHKGECLHSCPGAFRIIPSELELYRAMNVALPRLCPNCRYSEHLAHLTPYKLWKRQCMCQSDEAKNRGHNYQNSREHSHGSGHCPNIFETAYAPERPDFIYCEECYHKEVL